MNLLQEQKQTAQADKADNTLRKITNLYIDNTPIL